MRLQQLSVYGSLLMAALALGLEARTARAEFRAGYGATAHTYGRSYRSPFRDYTSRWRSSYRNNPYRRSYRYRYPYRSDYGTHYQGRRFRDRGTLGFSPRIHRHHGRDFGSRFRSPYRGRISPYPSYGGMPGHTRGYTGPGVSRWR